MQRHDPNGEVFFAAFVLLLVLVGVGAIIGADTEPVSPMPKRIAICHDGNEHDHDDIGAVAMAEAIVWRDFGATVKLVHLDHSNHLGQNDTWQHGQMVISAESALQWFNISPAVVFDNIAELQSSTDHLAQEIARSSWFDRLHIAQGGPWEVMCQAFDKADPASHEFVTIVTHSDWNDEHKHHAAHRNRESFLAQYGHGGKWFGYRPPTIDEIPDQNWHGFTAHESAWEWLDQNPHTAFVHDRTIASGYSHGDMSDAGMTYYLVTGDEEPSQWDIQNFFMP